MSVISFVRGRIRPWEPSLTHPSTNASLLGIPNIPHQIPTPDTRTTPNIQIPTYHIKIPDLPTQHPTPDTSHTTPNTTPDTRPTTPDTYHTNTHARYQTKPHQIPTQTPDEPTQIPHQTQTTHNNHTRNHHTTPDITQPTTQIPDEPHKNTHTRYQTNHTKYHARYQTNHTIYPHQIPIPDTNLPHKYPHQIPDEPHQIPTPDTRRTTPNTTPDTDEPHNIPHQIPAIPHQTSPILHQTYHTRYQPTTPNTHTRYHPYQTPPSHSTKKPHRRPRHSKPHESSMKALSEVFAVATPPSVVARGGGGAPGLVRKGGRVTAHFPFPPGSLQRPLRVGERSSDNISTSYGNVCTTRVANRRLHGGRSRARWGIVKEGTERQDGGFSPVVDVNER
ncbi:hypothetical protein C7M84_015187 [Penaeus vannamei]|uniref:Uncharacterized protein n=1 Tax=Penaeus vannamei TaxID=6689 RepID=A0A3R7Q2F9_PENVA|nr:hypothetical protein C7M84_015187 [Penaeus vannamei]